MQYAHPLDGGDGAEAWRSVTRTARALGPDGPRWQEVFGYPAARMGQLTDDILRPMWHMPRHPLELSRYGMVAATPARVLARLWTMPGTRALFAGLAAHAMRPFAAAMSSAIGVTLGAAAHAYGWPVARGGSGTIARATTAILRSLSGTIHTATTVASLHELEAADVVMLDVTPAAAVRIAGNALSPRMARALLRFRAAPGAFQASYAVEEGIPWKHESSRRAGTVHVGGSFEEVAAAEAAVSQGRMPERPFVLVGQQHVADPTRRRGNLAPIDAYAHVPSGFTRDATQAIEQQIERFAPGFRDRVVARHTRSTIELAHHNRNLTGGDVIGGANTPTQLIFRPRITPHPYSLGVPGLYLCSASTPPGAGAHGMCGYNAALAAISFLERR